MADWKYDDKTMTYTTKSKFKKVLFRGCVYFVVSIVLAIIYYCVVALIFDTPYEKKLRNEYDKMLYSYDSIHAEYMSAKFVLDHLEKEDTMIYRSVFKTNPTKISGEASSKLFYDSIENFSDKRIVTNANNTVKKLSAVVAKNDERINNYLKIFADSAQLLKSIPSVQPVSNADLKRTGASVGMKIHPFYRVAKMHKGIDYTVPIGTEVYATADGVVESIEVGNSEKGTVVTINHGNGYRTVYAHLAKATVARGANVKRGKVIALSGDTGMSIWPHLHYEVWKDKDFLDPIICFFAELNPAQLKKISELSSNSGQSLD